MSKHAAQNVVQMNVAMIECSLSVPWSVRNDAIWVAEHMRRRHLLLREEELAECSSGLCVLMMAVRAVCENEVSMFAALEPDDLVRQATRDFHRRLIVPHCFVPWIEMMQGNLHKRYPKSVFPTEELSAGVIVHRAIAYIHDMCEIGDIESVVGMHRVVEADPLWGLALRQNRERDVAL